MPFCKNADVVIIGAGVIGASIAYHLTLEKIRPVLLEAGSVACGSTGACEGMLLLQSKKPGIHLEMAMQSMSRFATLSDELGTDIEYDNKGGLVVMETMEEREAMQAFAKKQQACGADVTFLSTEDARELEPALSPEITGATYSPIDSQANPLKMAHGFLKAAKRNGAQLFTQIPVKGIRLKNDRVVAVVTEKGVIETGLVINAAGAFGARVAAMVGLSVPIKPRRGQILITEAMPPILKRDLLSAKYIAAKFNPQIAASGGVGFGVEQTANGNVLMGSTREFVGFDRKTTYEGLISIAQTIARVLPPIRKLHIIRAFAGLRPYTPDGLPILGESNQVPGFVMAAGHEGDGITLSPLTGEIIAQLVSNGKASFPMEPFRPERFAETQA